MIFDTLWGWIVELILSWLTGLPEWDYDWGLTGAVEDVLSCTGRAGEFCHRSAMWWINYFVPMREAVVMLGGLASMWLVGGAIRVVQRIREFILP